MRASFLALATCLAGTAHAESRVALAPALEDGFVPTIEATITGAPLPADAITLRVRGERDAVVASRVRAYADGPEPIVIAIVLSVQTVFVGNDDVEKDEGSKYYGVLKQLEKAIDRLDPKTLAPAGSKVIVVGYSTGARIIAPLRPLAELRGSTLGTQDDYRVELGTDMAAGIQLGVAALRKVVAPRKALIVIGDGNDTNNEAARSELDALAADAADARIESYAVIYKSVISSDSNVITRMIPNAITVGSIQGLDSALSTIKERLTDRYYVTFPASEIWDGGEHELVVQLDKVDLAPIAIRLPGRPAQSRLALWLLFLGAGLLVLGFIALRARSRFALG